MIRKKSFQLISSDFSSKDADNLPKTHFGVTDLELDAKESLFAYKSGGGWDNGKGYKGNKDGLFVW